MNGREQAAPMGVGPKCLPTRRPAAALALLPLLLPLLAVRATAQSAPAGWTVGHVAGGVVTYTPPGLGPGQVYTIAIFPRAPLGGGTLEDRLRAALEGDAALPGAGPSTPITRKGSVAMAGRVFTVKGHQITVLYTEILGAGETAQLQRDYYTRGLYDKYKGDTLAVSRAMAHALERPPAEDRPDRAQPPPVPPAAVPPGAGVKPSQIAGIYTEQVMQMGVGGFFTQVFKPLLALKDGTFCEYLDVPPSEFDVADSRRRYPDRWGRWRTNASATSRRWEGSAQHIQTLSKKGVWETAEWIGPLSGGGPGQRLSGTYTNTGGGGNVAYGGDMAVIQQSFYSFSPAGRFRCGRSIGGSTDTGTIASKRTTGGTYTLGGYGITLRFDDGTVRRCLYARVKDGMIFMQDEAYVTGKDR